MGVGGQSVAMDQLLVILLAASVAAQDYGPVSLDSVDALTLNWNQIQWLVKDQIKEVEELREEHNELYNEITRCFGNEKCLAEFELLDMSPGSKLHGLGLRALDLSGSAMSRMREEVLKTKARLDLEMRSGGRWTRRSKRIRPDLLHKRRRWLQLRPRGSPPPPPPPPRHRHRRQEAPLRLFQGEAPRHL